VGGGGRKREHAGWGPRSYFLKYKYKIKPFVSPDDPRKNEKNDQPQIFLLKTDV